MSLRIPLTPYDRVFLGGHQALRRAGLPGHACYYQLDVTGRLEHAELRAALARVMDRHPLTTTGIRHTILTSRAYWAFDRERSRRAVADVDGSVLSYHDLRSVAAPDEAEREALLRCWREAQDPADPSQIRLLHFEHPGNRHRIVLRAPHYLADLEGAMMLLKAIGTAAGRATADGVATGGQTAGGATNKTLDALSNNGSFGVLPYPSTWSRRYVRRLAQGLTTWAGQGIRPNATMKSRAPATGESADYLFRCWPAEAMPAIGEAARAGCRPGAMLYTRHFMMTVLRAVDDLRGELGLRGEHYVIPLPFLRPRTAERTNATCNEVTVASFRVPRRVIERPSELDECLSRQIDAYTRRGIDEADWVKVVLAGWLRAGHYRWLMAHGGFTRYTIGFASFRTEADWTEFLGADIDNFCACGLPPIPPGVMLTFCRCGDRLNLGMAFFRHVCPPEMAERLAERIGAHLHGSGRR